MAMMHYVLMCTSVLHFNNATKVMDITFLCKEIIKKECNMVFGLRLPLRGSKILKHGPTKPTCENNLDE